MTRITSDRHLRIALIGDYDPRVTAHQAIPPALALAAEHLGVTVEPSWMTTDAIRLDALQDADGIWCVPASPYRSMDGALGAIRYAREQRRPFLGTCGGFQHALLEYARNVLGLTAADHEETSPDAAQPMIARMACSLVEASNAISLVDRTRIREIYGQPTVVEQYHCSFGLSPRYEAALDDGQLKFSARDDSGEVRAIELTTHPFFLATQFQPERSSLRGDRHPLITAFVGAAQSFRSAATGSSLTARRAGM
jgi:CTP synthase (UTP-ammonia lyase)